MRTTLVTGVSRRRGIGFAIAKRFVARHMPRGHWNTPDEAANVIALLPSTRAATITGQIIDAEGGFRRFTP